MVNKLKIDVEGVVWPDFADSYIKNSDNTVSMLEFLIQTMRDKDTVTDILSIILSYTSVDRLLLSQAFLKINFDYTPLEIVDINARCVFFISRVTTPFLLNMYLDKEFTLRELVEYIGKKGHNRSKKWLDEMILNQV